MADLKTKRTNASVSAFLTTIPDERRRKDCADLARVMKQVTKKKPEMWGTSVVGFGRHHYKYASGREGDWFITGFSPRKDALTLYFMSGLGGQEPLLRKLGKHKVGKGCLYVKRLEDVDLGVLKTLIERSVERVASP